MFSLPLSLGVVIEDVQMTGSAAIDLLGRLSIALYDVFGDAGSLTVDSSTLGQSLEL